MSASLLLLADDVQELQRCDSAGIMCLVAAAFPDIYLDQHSNQGSYGLSILPPESLELDLRGRTDVSGNGEFVYIDVGEVKRDPVYQKAVEQLGLRLGALRVLITTCVPHPQPDVRLVGRLFASKGSSEGERDVPDDQRTAAASKWGYSLYVHRF